MFADWLWNCFILDERQCQRQNNDPFSNLFDINSAPSHPKHMAPCMLIKRCVLALNKTTGVQPKDQSTMGIVYPCATAPVCDPSILPSMGV